MRHCDQSPARRPAAAQNMDGMGSGGGGGGLRDNSVKLKLSLQTLEIM